jgi:transforming growth factor-beta-induced protein
MDIMKSKKLRLGKITLLSLITTMILINNYSVDAKETVITDFSGSEKIQMNWRITDDRVMGGRSQGRFEITKQGIMKFSGNLSLENNGGFSSVRSGEVNLDLTHSAGLLLKVKGDGRTYQMRLGTEARYRSWDVSFSAEFQTERNKWIEVRIPFNAFKAGFRGRSLGNVNFDPSNIRRFGILLGDKKPGSFELEMDSISTYQIATENTLLNLVKSNARFKTLTKALIKSGLDIVLDEGGPFTVFAPTDSAFNQLPKSTLNELLSDKGISQLTSILKYHVISGRQNLADALSKASIESLEGNRINVAFDEGKIRVNNANLKSADISAKNGVVHIIDSVLTPPKPKIPTILEIAEKAGSFKTLLAAVESAGLTEFLESNDQVTIFAPTDEAFSKLPKGTVEQLLKSENRDQLTSVLINHAVQGLVGAGDALKVKSANTLGNQSLNFKIAEGRFQVNGITVLTADLTCANGMIHVIDEVLLFDNEKEDSDVASVEDAHINMPPQKRHHGRNPRGSSVI